MQPVRAIPSNAEPSDQTGGTPARTARRSCGSARPQCESSQPPAGLCRAWARAVESLSAVPGPELGQCHRPHRPVRVGSCADRRTGRQTLRPAVAPPGSATPPPFDSHRSHELQSPRPRAAGRARHRLSAAPSRIGRAPRGWAQFARPFFCRLLGAVQQYLIPVDPLQGFRALGQVLPRAAKGILLQPHSQPPLDGFVRGKTRGQHLPTKPRHQHIEHGVQTFAVVRGRTPIATPDPRWENRFTECPHVIGHLPGKIGQLHAQLLPPLLSRLSQDTARGRFCLIVLSF